MNGKAARGWGRRLVLKPLAAFLLITKFTHSVKVYAKLSVVHAINDVKKQKKRKLMLITKFHASPFFVWNRSVVIAHKFIDDLEFTVHSSLIGVFARFCNELIIRAHWFYCRRGIHSIYHQVWRVSRLPDQNIECKTTRMAIFVMQCKIEPEYKIRRRDCRLGQPRPRQTWLIMTRPTPTLICLLVRVEGALWIRKYTSPTAFDVQHSSKGAPYVVLVSILYIQLTR